MSTPRIVALLVVATASITPLGGIAQAEPITLTTGFTSFSAEADTVSLLANTVSLDLASLKAGTLTGLMQSGTLQAGVTPGVNANFPFTLSRLVTLGDVSHVVTQSGSVLITPLAHTLTLNASPRTVFDLGSQGSVALSFTGAGLPPTTPGNLLAFNLGLQVAPTPEPSTLSLLGMVVAAWGTRQWKRRHLKTGA